MTYPTELQEAVKLRDSLQGTLDLLDTIFPPETTLREMGEYYLGLDTKIFNSTDPKYLTDSQQTLGD